MQTKITVYRRPDNVMELTTTEEVKEYISMTVIDFLGLGYVSQRGELVLAIDSRRVELTIPAQIALVESIIDKLKKDETVVYKVSA